MSDKKIVAIIQARMGSRRLPGKMAMPLLGGKGPLEILLERLAPSRLIDKIVVATSTQEQDDVLADICQTIDVGCYRGSESDVLDRYYQASDQVNADVVVRLTGDCPLHDYRIVDQAIDCFLKHHVEYVSNTTPPSYPDGLDVEVFSFAALKKTWQEAPSPWEREHVTPYMVNNKQLFARYNLMKEADDSDLRITLDEIEDLALLRAICKKLGGQRSYFTFEQIITLLRRDSEMRSTNAHLKRNAGFNTLVQQKHE